MSAWYTFEKQSAVGFCDESGNGFDADVHGDVVSERGTLCGTAALLCGEKGYIEMPAGVMNGIDEFTLEMWLRLNSQGYWERAFDFGREENGRLTAYIFFAPGAGRVALSSVGHYSRETVLEINPASSMDGWIHFAFEMKDGAVSAYINGELSAALWDESIKMADYHGLNRLYFGKSQYKDDPYLRASIGEIRLHCRLLGANEIKSEYSAGLRKMAENEIAGFELKHTRRLSRDLELPDRLPECGAGLVWTSSAPNVITGDGVISRPPVGRKDASAVLTAKVAGSPVEKSFEVTVAPEFTDTERVISDVETLDIGGDLHCLTHDIDLPVKGGEGCTIIWTASGAIDALGRISRPNIGSAPAEAALTARVSCGSASAERVFEISVPPHEKQAGYLFVYFTGNNVNEERLHYAITRDGYHFAPLNGGRYVLRQTLGTRCLRDPFVIRGRDGYFYLIATDMQSSKGWDSNRGLITWKSADLINWTDETVISVADSFFTTMGADRVWAPQVIYDEARGEYMVYFAVRIRRENPYSASIGLSGRETQMWYAYTKDFKTFTTEPKLLFRPKRGQGIDGDICFRDGIYYMYYKDESNAKIKYTTAKSPSGPYGEEKLIDTGFDVGLEGVCVYKVPGRERWIMIADAYGANRYVMQESDDMVNFRPVPWESYSFKNFHPRHGHVIPLSERRVSALIDRFGVEE